MSKFKTRFDDCQAISKVNAESSVKPRKVGQGRKRKQPHETQGEITECNKNVIFSGPGVAPSGLNVNIQGRGIGGDREAAKLKGALPSGGGVASLAGQGERQAESRPRGYTERYRFVLMGGRPPGEIPGQCHECAARAGRARAGHPETAGGAEKKETGSTRAKKFVEIKEKRVESKKVVKYAGRTVTDKALDLDTEGGEVPMFKPMTQKTLERMDNCLNWMKLATPEDYSKFKKTEGYTCRVAFCPVCAAFQSRRDGLKIGAMMDAMIDLPSVAGAVYGGKRHSRRTGMVQGRVSDDVRLTPGACLARVYGEEAGACRYTAKAAEVGVVFAMLTLTTPNVKGDDLKAEEKRFAKGFNLMVKNWLMRDYKNYYLGYARKLEVTYNKQKRITQQMWDGTGKYNDPGKWKYRKLGLKVGDRNPDFNTYNPHYHVLLAVTPDFFTYDEANQKWVPAISQQLLLATWRKYMGDDAGVIKQVKIQRVEKVRGEGNGATAEISKYVAKDSDYNYSPQVFRTFYAALKGCKRLTYGGIFQTFRKLFKEGKLDRYIPADETEYKWEIEYGWHGNGYNENGRVELSPERAAKIRGMKYTEALDTDDF